MVTYIEHNAHRGLAVDELTLQVKRFMTLFKGNTRSFGKWDPKAQKSRDSTTIKEAVTFSHYMAHINGVMGLGIVPIRDDGHCYWGAIDVDNHDDTSKDLDLSQIESKVKSMNLPLTVCRSKSGGAHLYLFGSEPLRADMVKTVLTRWMSDLNIEGSDCVFPKQSRLVLDGEGNRALGNWINLPYFGGDDTIRYAVDKGGKKCSLDLFLTNAEATAITQEQLDAFYNNEHSEAPPCIQAAVREGVQKGLRNEALFHLTIYNRKRNPEGAREATHAMQAAVFSDPLPFSEADKTIRSAAKKSYGYLCKKEPWKDWCDRETCRKRKFGISESEYEILSADTKLPLFSNLTKYMNTEPVMWELQMNGVPIVLTTDELMDYKAIRMRAMERLHMVLPSNIKPAQWTDEILASLFENLTIEEAPMESSPTGVLKIRLLEFLKKADLGSDGMDPAERQALMRGMPVVQFHRDERYVMFRSIDFEDYLKRTRTEMPRNKNLWYKANKDMGVVFERIRVCGTIESVWMVRVDDISTDYDPPSPNFDKEY